MFTLAVALVSGVGGAWAATDSAPPAPTTNATASTTSTSPATNPTTNPNAGLRVAVSGATSAPNLVLTNTASAQCQVAGTSLGTTVFNQVMQHGASVQPLSADVAFEDSVGQYLASRLETVAPDNSVQIPLRVVPFGPTGTALETVAWSETSASLGSLYPIVAGQPLQLAATYAEPIAASGAIPVCAVAGAAEATATLGASAASPQAHSSPAHSSRSLWIAIGAGVLLLLLLVGLLMFLLRRRKATAAARIGVVLALLGGGLALTGVTAQRASATVTVSSGLTKAFGPCSSLFNGPGGDPAGILPTLNAPGVTVQIVDANGDQTHEIKVPGGGPIIIFWNPNDHHAYAGGGGNADPCTSLYHEMYHGAEDAKGGQDHTECWTAGPGGKPVDSGLPTNEVNATRAQNLLRQKLGLPQRTHYGDTPLPTGPCQPPPKNPNPTNCTGPGCGDTNGDPHLTTFDGRRYDFQAAGEFVAARDPRGGFQIQVRQQPFPGSRTVSVNTAIALDVAGDRVEVRNAEQGLLLLVNGAPQASTTLTLPHGGSVASGFGASGQTLTVTWPDTSVAAISRIGPWGLHLSARPAGAHAGHLEGLLGNFNGDPADDVRPAGGGSPIAAPSFATLYPGFADSWRVAGAASLFTYEPGTSTDTYTDRSFPHAATAPNQIPNPAQAQKVCASAGITDPATLQDCELDVGLTGQPDFAAADATSQAEQVVGAFGIDGPATTVDITAPGSTARLHFTATAGQKVFVDVPTSTLPDQCGVLELDGPDGKEVTSGCIISGSGFIDGTVLPVSGQYTVAILPALKAVGILTVRVIGDTDQAAAITPDGPAVTADIRQSGAVSRFTFQAVPGTKVFIGVPTSTLPDQCGVLELDGPDGKEVTSGCIIGGSGYIDGTVLQDSGTYTVVVDPRDRIVGQADLRLSVDHDQAGTLTVNGPPVIADIAQPGAASRFTFQGTAGQKVSVVASASTLPDRCGILELDGPDGKQVASGCIIGGSGSILSTTLAVTGQYTVLVQLHDQVTGTAVLRLVTGS